MEGLSVSYTFVLKIETCNVVGPNLAFEGLLNGEVYNFKKFIISNTLSVSRYNKQILLLIEK